MSELLTHLTKIGIAVILSGLIGYERETQHKSVGLRDTILICLGATSITIFTLRLTNYVQSTQVSFDLIRAIAYYLVALGFVGGGIVNKYKNKVEGITTGTLLLPVAILGFYCGIECYLEAIVLGIVIYLILKFKYFKIKFLTIKKLKNKRRK